MYKVKNEKGEWVEVEKPEQGQRYRLIHTNGGMVESIWLEPTPKPSVVVTNKSSRVVVAVNSTTTLNIEVRLPDGSLMPLSDSFAVPIRRVGGAIERTVGVNFVDGVTTKDVAWPSSGEFEITEDLINMHLPPEQQFSFDKLSISVYED